MDNLKDKLVQASKVYADQTVVRAAINAIPYVGGSLDILLSSSGQNFVIRRIETFISELNDQLGQLDKSKVNHDFLQTEEGFDLVVKAFNSASRTRQNEKLKLYAKIIKGALTEGKEYQEDDPELYLQIIEELSVNELRVAKCLYELKEVKKKNPEQDNPNGKQDGMTNDAWWLSKQYPEFDKDELVSIFVRLERTGLIKELVGSFLGYGGGQYLINPLFKKFIDFIGEID
jgi:hypothetical protein